MGIHKGLRVVADRVRQAQSHCRGCQHHIASGVNTALCLHACSCSCLTPAASKPPHTSQASHLCSLLHSLLLGLLLNLLICLLAALLLALAEARYKVPAGTQADTWAMIAGRSGKESDSYGC